MKALTEELGVDRTKRLQKEHTRSGIRTANNFDNKKDANARYKHYKMYDTANNVLNGIAYDNSTDTFLVTGKMWDHVYQIKLDYEEKVKYLDENQEAVKSDL